MTEERDTQLCRAVEEAHKQMQLDEQIAAACCGLNDALEQIRGLVSMLEGGGHDKALGIVDNLEVCAERAVRLARRWTASKWP